MGVKPTLLTRLSNIIFIQVLFVFGALYLVFFYPSAPDIYSPDYFQLKDQFDRLGLQLQSHLVDKRSMSGFSVDSSQINNEIVSRFGDARVSQAYLYSFVNNEITCVYALADSTSAEADLAEIVDPRIIQMKMGLQRDMLMPGPVTSHHAVYYYKFDITAELPAVLALVFDNDLIMSNRPEMLTTLLLLFLASTLVSLLIIYILQNRFQEPLRKLIKGFEKTSEGELYYMVETDGDTQVKELANAFNSMSGSLWRSSRRLKKYNELLRKSNAALRESQEHLETLINRSPNAVVSTDARGRVSVFNERATELFEVRREEMIGEPVESLFANSVELRQRILTDHIDAATEVLCRRVDDSIFPAYMITSPIKDHQGNVVSQLYIIKDISESKSFQEMMIRVDRYYTKGEMAGDIAHEINNFLAILSGNVELMPLFLKKGDTEKIEKKLELMRNTIDRIAKFTDGLLDVNSDSVKFDLLDINQLVETVLAFMKPQNKFDDIEIVTHLSDKLPLTEVDIGQVQQLLVNLVYNAGEALADREEGARVEIRTSLAREDETEARVRIEIQDNGPGVQTDKEHLLFKKRFTTKPHGHGIGLMTCKRILDTHCGSIRYEFRDGAYFAFEIPVKHPHPVDSDQPESVAPAPVQ